MMNPLEWAAALGFFFALGCMIAIVIVIDILRRKGWL